MVEPQSIPSTLVDPVPFPVSPPLIEGVGGPGNGNLPAKSEKS
jgi:hypothetical protein